MNTTHLPIAAPPARPTVPALQITLPVGAVRTLVGCAGARIEVTLGRVWVTEPGDLDDHFLARGDSHRLASAGRVVIESDGAHAAVLRVVRGG